MRFDWRRFAIGLMAVLVVSTAVATLDALSGTPGPATAPCVAPSPPK